MAKLVFWFCPSIEYSGYLFQCPGYRSGDLEGYGWEGFKSQRLLSQDKGQTACALAFVESIRSGQPAPISYEEIMEVARVSIEVAEQLRG